jgi:hypothetical protein
MVLQHADPREHRWPTLRRHKDQRFNGRLPFRSLMLGLRQLRDVIAGVLQRDELATTIFLINRLARSKGPRKDPLIVRLPDLSITLRRVLLTSRLPDLSKVRLPDLSITLHRVLLTARHRDQSKVHRPDLSKVRLPDLSITLHRVLLTVRHRDQSIDCTTFGRAPRRG